MSKLRLGLIYVMPAVLFCAYYPVIPLGATESMNLELSLPLLWLAIFALVNLPALPGLLRWLVRLPKRHDAPANRGSIPQLLGRILLLALPAYLWLSVGWSGNPLRGVLTAGIFTLVEWAALMIWQLRGQLSRVAVRRAILWPAAIISVFCWVQCVLDVAGVPRSVSLMCQGCVWQAFGFPHPNGLAIEPQFMGNLLLLPTLLGLYLVVRGRTGDVLAPGAILSTGMKPGSKASALVSSGATGKSWHSSGTPRQSVVIFTTLLLTSTLFLTFSRGAIYSLMIGAGLLLVLLLCFPVGQGRTKGAKAVKATKVASAMADKGSSLGRWRALVIIPLLLAGFGIALVAQGCLAQASPTGDTFATGVAKVIHQLTLGRVDLRATEADAGASPKATGADVVAPPDSTEADAATSSPEPLEGPDTASTPHYSENASTSVVGGSEGLTTANSTEDTQETAPAATFDGYVAESTNVRVMLTDRALALWASSPRTKLTGVGLGGAGVALAAAYPDQLGPKEIVQNQYASALLELGLIGVALIAALVAVGLWWLIRGLAHSGCTPVNTLAATSAEHKPSTSVNTSPTPLKSPMTRPYASPAPAVLLLPVLLAYAVSLGFFSGLPNALHIYLLPVLLVALF